MVTGNMDSDSFIDPRGGKNIGGTYFENNNLQQPLLENQSQYANENSEDDESFGCWYKIKRSMGWTVSKEKRAIRLSGKTIPNSFPSNKLNN
jgi:hypothetical protein